MYTAQIGTICVTMLIIQECSKEDMYRLMQAKRNCDRQTDGETWRQMERQTNTCAKCYRRDLYNEVHIS